MSFYSNSWNDTLIVFPPMCELITMAGSNFLKWNIEKGSRRIDKSPPRAEVFWQIPTAWTDKMTNPRPIPGGGGDGHAWLTEPLLLDFSTDAYFYLAGFSLLTASFLLFPHRRYKIFMLFSQRNSSPLFFISRFSSYPRQCRQKFSRKNIWLCCLFHSKSRGGSRFCAKNLELQSGRHTCWLSYFTVSEEFLLSAFWSRVF